VADVDGLPIRATIGETGEFASENMGFGLNPGVELGPALCLSSNQREPKARENLLNVADTCEVDHWRRCQQVSRFELGQKSSGSPSWTRFEL
jgi:hypothetical protein